MRSIHEPRTLIAQRLNFDCWAQILEKVVGRSAPVGTMEMAHLAVLLGRLKELASEDGPDVADMISDDSPAAAVGVIFENDDNTWGVRVNGIELRDPNTGEPSRYPSMWAADTARWNAMASMSSRPE